MTEIEKMQRYIDNTKINRENSSAYTMRLNEMIALARMSDASAIDAICLAFEFGRAKGARCAKARFAR